MKNNNINLMKENQKPKHGMRKLKVGYVSCLLGVIIVFGQFIPSFTIAGVKINNNMIYAETPPP